MENLNSVCYINKINKIELIEGADKIEKVTINGWTTVSAKGVHKEGDLILCITTDAVIPEELAEKWGVTSYLRKGCRVRTVKLKGVYSECVIIPLKQIPLKLSETTSNLYEGRDLMERLNICKYEPPVREIITSVKKVHFKWNEIHKLKMWKSWVNYKKNKVRNYFRKFYKDNINFEKYYKFPNQKNVPHMFNNNDLVEITRKLHGTNSRYGIVKKNILTWNDRIRILFGNEWAAYEYVYGSHNVEKGSDSQGFYSTDVWAEIAEVYNLKNKLWAYAKSIGIKRLGKGVIIYGEIYGPGIQKNYDYNLEEIQFAGFDIQINGEYLGYGVKNLDFETVLHLPTVETLFLGCYSKEKQDSLVFNQYIPGTKIPHEGVVVKCISGNRRRISKVINPDYLIYGEKHGTTDSH